MTCRSLRRRRALGDHDGGGGHDGGGMMRWLLTYADMITLLTAFFIMMYSMSVINLARFHQVAIAIKSGFNGEQLGAGLFDKGGVVYIEEDKKVPTPAPELDRIMKELKDYIQRHGLKSQVMCRLEERGLVISLSSDGLLFDRGQADIRPGAQLLDDIGSVVAKLQNEVMVEGNTCDLPISTPQYPSNWELSTARATTVVRYLIDQHHVSPSRIGAAGYADARPLVKNDQRRAPPPQPPRRPRRPLRPGHPRPRRPTRPRNQTHDGLPPHPPNPAPPPPPAARSTRGSGIVSATPAYRQAQPEDPDGRRAS